MTSLHKYKHSIIKDLNLNLNLKQEQQSSHTDLIILCTHLLPEQWKKLKSDLFKLNPNIQIIKSIYTDIKELDNKGNTRIIKLNHLDQIYVNSTITILEKFPSIILIGSYFHNKFINIYDLQQIIKNQSNNNNIANSNFQPLLNQLNNPLLNNIYGPLLGLNQLLFLQTQKLDKE